MQALTYLQRALLVHDLQTLSAVEWESCFNKVLFPLLAKLLEQINPLDPVGLEETRSRAATLLCKVFLQHLTPLLSLATFTALWLTILDFMDKYMHADKSELLYEAIPQSLKNMVLVMDTANVFRTDPGSERGKDCQLWVFTWERIDCFLPGLRDEVFKCHEPVNRDPAPSSATTNAPTPGGIVRDGSPNEEQPSTVDTKPEEADPPTPAAPDTTPAKSDPPSTTTPTPITTPIQTVAKDVNPVTSQPNIILQPPLFMYTQVLIALTMLAFCYGLCGLESCDPKRLERETTQESGLATRSHPTQAHGLLFQWLCYLRHKGLDKRL
ncbi:Golgi-specific brefeldin A-resistance guanine nucleotide exchange factor 1-like [Asterias amurensis]|uniref:Golgi-specific brefeldin A-resistance guanine nucleotide exchange factor 1-like n=1 Tax=Asterias amurensis TaxID=7602 RepID=UPI003AB6A998